MNLDKLIENSLNDRYKVECLISKDDDTLDIFKKRYDFWCENSPNLPPVDNSTVINKTMKILMTQQAICNNKIFEIYLQLADKNLLDEFKNRYNIN